jgi:hypothetical protein
MHSAVYNSLQTLKKRAICDAALVKVTLNDTVSANTGKQDLSSMCCLRCLCTHVRCMQPGHTFYLHT